MLYVSGEKARATYKVRHYAGQLMILRAERSPTIQKDLGWKDVVWGGVEVKQVSGTHGDLLLDPFVEEVAVALKECIDKTLEDLQQKV